MDIYDVCVHVCVCVLKEWIKTVGSSKATGRTERFLTWHLGSCGGFSGYKDGDCILWFDCR